PAVTRGHGAGIGAHDLQTAGHAPRDAVCRRTHPEAWPPRSEEGERLAVRVRGAQPVAAGSRFDAHVRFARERHAVAARGVIADAIGPETWADALCAWAGRRRGAIVRRKEVK